MHNNVGFGIAICEDLAGGMQVVLTLENPVVSKVAGITVAAVQLPIEKFEEFLALYRHGQDELQRQAPSNPKAAMVH